MPNMKYQPPFYSEWKTGKLDTLLAALDRAVAAVPDKTFLDIDGAIITYRAFDSLSTRLAHSLAELGVKEGETFVTFLETSIDPLVGWFAANKIGAIWVPVNTSYRGQFLAHQIRDAGASVMICEAHFLGHVLQVLDELPVLTTILVRGSGEERREGTVRILPLDAHRGENDAPIAREIRPADLTCLIYTSGTTGPSKGCMIPHGHVMQFGWQNWESVPQGPEDVSWSPLPIFHVGALVSVVLSSLISHGSGALTSGFSVTRFWPEVERTGANVVFILGSMLTFVAEAESNPSMERCFGQIRMMTGVPLSLPIRKIWQERFGVQHINSCNFAQSEVSKLGHVAYSDPMPPLDSAGYVNSADFELMIADDEGFAVPTGMPGELLCRPKRPNVMFSGYWRRPEATAEAWRNLWMHTGDVAKIDENNVLYFVDRKKDYLRRGGENISSWEMEATFKQHPAVSDVAVHAVKSEVAEDEVKVTIILKEGIPAREEELFAWCLPHVPRFAIPRYIEFRSALPMTPTGKVQKYRLRDDGCTPTTWEAHPDLLREARRRR